MSINLYASGDGAKAMALCPLKRIFTYQDCVLRIREYYAPGWYADNNLLVYALYPDMALAVIREHLRKMLSQRGVFIAMVGGKGKAVANIEGQFLREDGEWTYEEDEAEYHDDDNYALIRGVLAVFGKDGAE